MIDYAYEPVPTTSSHGGLEDENETMTEHLKDKIHALKSLSIDIGNEVQYQDKMLRGMVNNLSILIKISWIYIENRNMQKKFFVIRMKISKGQVVY